MAVPLPRIESILPTPIDRTRLIERLRLTGVALGQALLAVPALVLGILSLLAVPLTLVLVGLGLAHLAVPATERLTNLHRWISGQLLGEQIPAGYAETTGTNPFVRAFVWLRDPGRWRDVAFLWFSATGGFVLSIVVVGLLVAPIVHLIGLLIDPSWLWVVVLCFSGPGLLVWWLITPALVRGRALAERGILGHSRVEQLSRRVEQVTTSRSEALDHSAAEVRRIERDLHDGAQARIAAVGMNVGLAEKLLATDPSAAAELLREAREGTVSALDDLALALAIPVPVTTSFAIEADLPAPVESAAYFAVTECLTNVVKHAVAQRAWVTGTHDGVQPRRGSHRRDHGAAVPARIVLAEDQAHLRVGLTRILQATGFDVVAAVDNAPALEAALADPDADAAVVDVRMPPSFSNEGLVAAIEARARRAAFPVLVLSQYVEPLYARELLASGVGSVGYLLKDRVSDVDRFVASFEQVIAGGTVLDPEVVAAMVGGVPRDHPIERLTDREREVLTLMAEGRSNAAIAAQLFVSEKAVGKHINGIFTKLDLPQAPDDNRRVLAVLAWLEGNG